MATQKTTLNKSTVDGITHGDRRFIVWDDKLEGFGVLVLPSGIKSYIFNYRLKNGSKEGRFTIGRVGDITPSDARKVAENLRSDVNKGMHPAAERRDARAASKIKPMTVGDMLDRFLKEHVEPNNKPSTLAEEKRLFTKLVRPKLGKLPLKELTRGKVKEWHTSIPAKTSGNRALAHLRRACRFAIEHEWIDLNPCSNLTMNKEQARDRFFSDDELKGIGQALRELVAEGRISESVADGIRLLAFTGMRAGEARGARWVAFDPVRKVLHLDDAKTGARDVPLSPEAIALLNGMERHGDYIIASPKMDGEEIGVFYFVDAMRSVLTRATLEDASLHTFRHTVATFMAQHGDDIWTISRMGGWKTVAMIQGYVARAAIGDRHPLPATQRIAIALAGGNVVPMVKSA